MHADLLISLNINTSHTQHPWLGRHIAATAVYTAAACTSLVMAELHIRKP
jgi:hypothetical protein